MTKQLSRSACFGVVIGSMLVFSFIAGMFSSRTATAFLGTYIAYLLFQLIFFYIFRTVYKNKDRGWATLLAYIGFAVIPAFLGAATRYGTPPANLLAPFSAFVIFIAGWWILFAVRKNLAATARMSVDGNTKSQN